MIRYGDSVYDSLEEAAEAEGESFGPLNGRWQMGASVYKGTPMRFDDDEAEIDRLRNALARMESFLARANQDRAAAEKKLKEIEAASGGEAADERKPARPCIVDDIEYPSISAGARKIGCKPMTLWTALIVEKATTFEGHSISLANPVEESQRTDEGPPKKSRKASRPRKDPNSPSIRRLDGRGGVVPLDGSSKPLAYDDEIPF